MVPVHSRDLSVGIFVLGGLLAISYLALTVGGVSYKGANGFRLTATFDDIGALKPRSRVVISGVSVGQVESIALDEYMRAEVRLDLDPALELSVDTAASIRTSGLLGDQFISLEPGAEDDLLKPGEEITYTENALSLERLIGKFVNNSGLND